MSIPPPPRSRLPSVQDPETLGLGARSGVRLMGGDVDIDTIRGEGVPQFFKNIGRAFTKTWNQKPTKQEKAVLAPMLGSMSLMTKAMPVVGAPANIAIDALKDKYGVGLYAGANMGGVRPMGRGVGCSVGAKKMRGTHTAYIKRA